MKSLFSFFTIAILSCSCSKDADIVASVPITTPHFISHISEDIYLGAPSHDEFSFNYNGDILQNIVIGENQITFTYDGDKIALATYNYSGQPDGSTLFHYNGDLLDYTLSDDESAEQTNYFYTAGSLSGKQSTYQNGFDTVILKSETFAFSNGNLVSSTIQNGLSGGETSMETFHYDNRNSPFRDMNRYFRMVFLTEGISGLSANNPISREFYNASNPTDISHQDYEITYDSEGFPTNILKYAEPEHRLISNTTITYR